MPLLNAGRGTCAITIDHYQGTGTGRSCSVADDHRLGRFFHFPVAIVAPHLEARKDADGVLIEPSLKHTDHGLVITHYLHRKTEQSYLSPYCSDIWCSEGQGDIHIYADSDQHLLFEHMSSEPVNASFLYLNERQCFRDNGMSPSAIDIAVAQLERYRLSKAQIKHDISELDLGRMPRIGPRIFYYQNSQVYNAGYITRLSRIVVESVQTTTAGAPVNEST